ncbi:hypothetical protein [Amycolatopsis pithecellobii]|uniref:Uncharacterized protein n=1 Tax=Amycolatopsis pithecellobii TaxID=664692 RepID=A0A6N7Z537_9PSEU|nr:hypothetical protein [Amycolatopsis pithecellobii]MTD55721.1 hypothetical protein [Amycolatopsis pithecellobii]
MLGGKWVSTVALTGVLAAGSQGTQSCDTTTGKSPSGGGLSRQEKARGVEYTAECDNDGNVKSYRPHTAEAKREAVRACKNVDDYADRIQRGIRR